MSSWAESKNPSTFHQTLGRISPWPTLTSTLSSNHPPSLQDDFHLDLSPQPFTNNHTPSHKRTCSLNHTPLHHTLLHSHTHSQPTSLTSYQTSKMLFLPFLLALAPLTVFAAPPIGGHGNGINARNNAIAENTTCTTTSSRTLTTHMHHAPSAMSVIGNSFNATNSTTGDNTTCLSASTATTVTLLNHGSSGVDVGINAMSLASRLSSVLKGKPRLGSATVTITENRDTTITTYLGGGSTSGVAPSVNASSVVPTGASSSSISIIRFSTSIALSTSAANGSSVVPTGAQSSSISDAVILSSAVASTSAVDDYGAAPTESSSSSISIIGFSTSIALSTSAFDGFSAVPTGAPSSSTADAVISSSALTPTSAFSESSAASTESSSSSISIIGYGSSIAVPSSAVNGSSVAPTTTLSSSLTSTHTPHTVVVWVTEGRATTTTSTSWVVIMSGASTPMSANPPAGSLASVAPSSQTVPSSSAAPSSPVAFSSSFTPPTASSGPISALTTSSSSIAPPTSAFTTFPASLSTLSPSRIVVSGADGTDTVYTTMFTTTTPPCPSKDTTLQTVYITVTVPPTCANNGSNVAKGISTAPGSTPAANSNSSSTASPPNFGSVYSDAPGDDVTLTSTALEQSTATATAYQTLTDIGLGRRGETIRPTPNSTVMKDALDDDIIIPGQHVVTVTVTTAIAKRTATATAIQTLIRIRDELPARLDHGLGGPSGELLEGNDAPDKKAVIVGDDMAIIPDAKPWWHLWDSGKSPPASKARW
ncbi:hypothetical protein EJ06DRAFT_582669 [Trichodelitschia bisporula]|uniref:Uncharacterized protein n=1 Tax=Trichodelitschia bisporula TaxID=703511 RepID=A0A6G1HVS8_9PEZI|nr:hypothetical protein EJ06DRAFT_582669 [Trichodelitschia bisporula]